MKTTTSLKLATMAAFAAIVSASAQSVPTLTPDDSPGFLGHKFTGIEYAYTHHVESAPRSLNRYGFVSQAPLADFENLDGAFHYDYTRGSAGGLVYQTHDVRAGFTRYFSHQAAKPFVDVQLGWAWQRQGPVKDNAFAYQAGVGAELPVNLQLAVIPFVNFEDAAPLGEGVWNYGARVVFRPHRQWSASFAVQFNDGHNIEYALGIQHRY